MTYKFEQECSLDFRRQLPVEMGIYGIFDANDKAIYIGASWNLRSRLTNHQKLIEFIKNGAVAIKYKVVDFDNRFELYNLEHDFIVYYKPSLNVRKTRSKTVRPPVDFDSHSISKDRIMQRSILSGSIIQKIVFELTWEYVLSSKNRATAIECLSVGTGLTPYWLRNFLDLPENKASCERVEILYNYLSGGSNLLELIESKEYKDQLARATIPVNKANLKVKAL